MNFDTRSTQILEHSPSKGSAIYEAYQDTSIMPTLQLNAALS